MTLQLLIDRIKRDSPKYIFVSDTHFDPKSKDLVSDLVMELSQQGLNVGLYIEALCSTTDVTGDYEGELHERWNSDAHLYKKLIGSVNDIVPVHGIDHPDADKINPNSVGRLEWWKQVIEEGTEEIKVVYVGAAHIENNRNKPGDIVSLLESSSLFVESDIGYIPPTFSGRFSFQHEGRGFQVAVNCGELCEDVERRFKEVVADLATQSVTFPGHDVSPSAVHSHSYADCNGVVLLAQDLVGLSHYNLEASVPVNYLPSLIADMRSSTCGGNLSAVLLGGDPGHLARNEEILGNEEIPVIGRYCDQWKESVQVSSVRAACQIPKRAKQLVAIASTQEVLMYSTHVGYQRLTPLNA